MSLPVLPDIRTAIHTVLNTIESEAERVHRGMPVQLVAVSKYKPLSDILLAYEEGQRCFGENYVQELLHKVGSPLAPKDIDWHFIGHLQSNKAAAIARIPNVIVETVDSLKLATRLSVARRTAGLPVLSIMLEVNTSGEANKSGVAPEDVLALYESISTRQETAHVQVIGLMTIGRVGEPRQAFEALQECKRRCDKEFGCDLKLSMGMSSDYQLAIDYGSNYVRVGSSIFGQRLAKEQMHAEP